MAKVKTQLSTKKELSESLKKNSAKIKRTLSKKDLVRKDNASTAIITNTDSKAKYSKGGKYLTSRIKIHNIIIKETLSKDKTTKKPDIYIFGGVGGSGKSSLNNFIKETTLTVNNDDIKKSLARYDPSGSKYMLIHAGYLHREAQDIEKKIIEKLLRQKKDIILDRTISDYKKNLELLKQFQSKGYKIHALGTSLKPHIAISRATSRFLKGDEGRYVPLEVIAKNGNKINKNAVRMARNNINSSSLIINTKNKKPSIIYSRNYDKKTLKVGQAKSLEKSNKNRKPKIVKKKKVSKSLFNFSNLFK